MMSCKHYYLKYTERTCTQCGRLFYICPICSKHQPYSWLCVDCESERRKQVRIEREAAYLAALELVDRLDRLNPGSGEQLTRRLWRADGQPILTLDQFVRAALDNELVVCPPRPEWLGEM